MKIFETEYERRELDQPEKDEHHRQLGDFVSQFAGVESAVYVLAQTLIDDPAVSACVLRDTQLARVVELSREIGRAKHGTSPFFPGLEAALLRIKDSAVVRNRLLHSVLVPVRLGLDGPMGLWAFSARRPSPPPESPDDLTKARAELDSATRDLFVSMTLLGLIKMPPEISELLHRQGAEQ